MPPAVKRYVAALAGAALAVLAFAVARMPAPDRDALLLAGVLTVCLTVAWLFPLHFAYKTKLHVDTAVVFAAVLLLDPGLALPLAGLGTLVAHLLRPDSREPLQVVFNSAQEVLQVAAGSLVLAAAGWDPLAPAFDRPAALLAIGASAVAMYLVNSVAVVTAVALQAERPLRQAWLESVFPSDRTELLSHLGLLGIGLLAVVVADASLWALVLLVPPVAAIFATLRHQLRLRLLAEEALHGTEASLAEAQRIARLGSLEWDLASGKQLWSDETYRILGFEPQSFPATADVFLGCIHPEDRSRVEVALRDALVRGEALDLDHRVLLADGSQRVVHQQGEVVPGPEGRPERLLGTIHDVTERKALEAQLAHRAFHDTLTGLPNRALFVDRLDRALLRRGDGRGAVAVMFLDLDGFKLVNDGLGHDAGDRLLVAVAERLRACLRPDDTAARFGGDEFTVLLEAVADAREASAVAERIATAIRQPFALDGREATVSASIGIALGSPGRVRAMDLLRDADSALYRAKAQGKNRAALFDPRMNADAVHQLSLRADLLRAVERGELRLHYQPQVDLATGLVVGVEALVRWQHPSHGQLRPDAFIPLAEETGVILPLGNWVLAEACRQAESWRRLHPELGSLRMAINVSLLQLNEEGWPARVAAALRESGIDPGRLVLEITESALAADPAATVARVRAARDLGVRVALDDFGVGSSSLGALRALEVDALKLDRSFVRGLGGDERGARIAAAVGSLAADLGLTLVAEGIETSDDLVATRSAGCRLGQGHLFAPALPAPEVGTLLAAGVPFAVAPNVRIVPLPRRRDAEASPAP